jgi:cytoplasmic iron level regulating protein YaaA (DUF328/UPF0246 family)
MRSASGPRQELRQPQLLHKAKELAKHLKTYSKDELQDYMHLSPVLAGKTQLLIKSWTAEPEGQTLALDTFLGDIYSGLHANDLSKKDRDYADKVLIILSGLYGCIRPYDGICPYRLEMGYVLPDTTFRDLYTFWEKDIAGCLPAKGSIVNLSAVEYSRTITPFVDPSRVVTPQFMTINPKTGEPTFVVVHAKIARGAYARWLITNKIEDIADFSNFTDLGYSYHKKLSTPEKPAFVCKEFGGIGLSIRLENKN